MAKKKQPTQRTLEKLRSANVTCDVVERFNAHVGPFGKRFDLFGCIDLIALVEGRGIVGIQATSQSNHSARLKKALDEPRLIQWLKMGGKFEVWSWKKTNPKGTKLTRWVPRIDEIKLPSQLTFEAINKALDVIEPALNKLATKEPDLF